MKNADLIQKMTLAEKAAILSGKDAWSTRAVPRLHIPEMTCSDGPHGVRRQAGAGDHLGINASLPATCFPTAASIANSFDESLGEEVGRALGEEAKTQGVNVLLGPGLNIKRSPLCGRNFEYFSEDPYLAGKMAASYVRGIQSEGVYSCIKHFAVNSQETRRMAMSSVLDERTLREIYLTGFEIAVKEGKAKAIMTSYNEVNGIYANENEHLLKDILREDWGFQGIVITDWGASNDHTKGVKAGSNLEMPNPGLDSARILIEGLNKGEITEEEIDERVDELLTAILETNAAAKGKKEEFALDAHHALARKAAVESAVLLKNEERTLPLGKGEKIAIIGDFAFEPRYQGAGSSVVNTTKLETISEMVKEYPELEVVGMARGYLRQGGEEEALAEEALALSKKADKVLFFFGLDEMSESEGLDRQHMEIHENQLSLLKRIHEVNPNIVGILSAGSSVTMGHEVHLKALLHSYLGGQAGAGAVLDLLTGRENPSGKLAETYPISGEDGSEVRYYPAKERTAEYREGIFVGYRYFDKAEVPVKYPFGYGLSYTSFSYSDLEVTEKGVRFSIENTGERDGAEIAELYIGLPESGIFRPKKELKGFKKVFLKAGEKKQVEIPFDDKSFRYWNDLTKQFEVERGQYRILIGASLTDIRLEGTLEKEGSTEKLPYQEGGLDSYFSGKVKDIPDAEFEKLLGHPIPDGHWHGELELNDALCQLYYAKSPVARLLFKILDGKKRKADHEAKPDLNILFLYNMPFRAIAKMSEGAVSMEMARSMVTLVNGHFFKGFGGIVGGYFKNRKQNKRYEPALKEGREWKQ